MAGCGEELLNDNDWYEVRVINSYAVLMSYISMAIKGLGFLVLTWTTVVLLGGFVSLLHTKDFWCLTFITLVQMAGVFDVVMNEKLRYIGISLSGIAEAFLDFTEKVEVPNLAYLAESLLKIVLVFVQLMILAAVLFPLAIIYVFGILMSGGISLWRLIEHDYSDSDGEASNLTGAMNTLYYLVLIQCVVFCYRFMLGRMGKRLAKHVVREGEHSEMKVVFDYLRETKTGCEKDPTFSNGRNLVTYAVDMIGSRSLGDRISGVMILYTSINSVEMKLYYQLKDKKEIMRYRQQRDGQMLLVKHLLLSVSSRDILQKLLEALDSRGLHGRGSRHQAAKIVDRIAFDIKLEQFPGGIEHISSMIGTFEEYSIAEPYQQDCLFHVHEQDWDLHARCLPPSQYWGVSNLREMYKMLLVRGLLILSKLAVDENNCRVMSHTRGLVSKIMAPLTSDLLHHTTDDHGACAEIVLLSMKVMVKLAGAPGETGAKLRREISSCKEAVSTMKRILGCNGCDEKLQLIAIRILTQLHMDTTEGSISADFVRKLVDIFTDVNRYGSIVRGYAGQELSVLCVHDGSNAIVVLQTGGGYVVDILSKVLVHDKDETCKQRAAEILEHLCTHYTKDDEYLGKLKKSMNDIMPKVIEKILLCVDGFSKIETDGCSKTETDLENQCVNSQGNGIGSSLQDDEQDEEEKAFQRVVQSVKSANLLSSLLSLCGTGHDKFISDLAQLCASSFLNKLKEVVEKSDHPNPKVENLFLIKIITKMAISMMKHSDGGLAKQEDLRSLIEALSSAWKNNMFHLDYSMVFSSGSSNTTSSKLDRCTLASLVKEAQELHAKLPSTSG